MNDTYVNLLNWLNLDQLPKTLVETGSHRGEGAATWASFFEKVYSIELSNELFEHCIRTHKLNNLQFLKGASTDVLQSLVSDIEGSYILFLDAHGSGGDTTFDPRVGRFGAPVLEEIECVRENPPLYILIDDLSDFDTIESYPEREQITDQVNSIADYEEPKVFNYRKGMLVYKLK